MADEEINLDLEIDTRPEHNYWKYLNAVDSDDHVKLSDRELSFISDMLERGELYVNYKLTKKQQHWILDMHDRLF